jgi:hypothetical protein
MDKSVAASATALTTTGIAMPSDFPCAIYEAVYARVRAWPGAGNAFGHFGGALNALSYRFRAAHDLAIAFQQNVKSEGTSPPPDPRYYQERLLFEFYSSCFSVLEAYFFALFTVAHILKPSGFPLATPADEQNVTPKNTLKLLARHFAGDPIISALTTLTGSDDYKALRATRNILTHRAAPGRLMYVSVGEDDAPPTEWKLDGQPITDDLLVRRLGQLVSVFQSAMVELDKFTEAHNI